MKYKLLLTLILTLVQYICFSQKTYTGASGSWNVATNWIPNGVPTASDDVIIPSGKTVSIAANAVAKSINLTGSLSLSNGVTLTIGTSSLYGNFSVNTGGSFTMPSGSGIATLIVYGNYYNNGSTDFWKSNVIIVGDLLSPSSSALQNQGNVVVAGNIIGAFSLNGGTGSNQIYAVNPNATVTITPTSIDNNVPPGSTVTEAALVELVNTVIYGSNTCTFNVNDPVSQTICVGTNATFTAATAQANPSYQWQINNGTGWADLSNGGLYSGVTTATLSISGATFAMNGYKYRAKITSGCSKNGNFAILTVNAAPSTPVTSITQPTCSTATGTISVTIQNANDTYSFDNGVTFQASNSKSNVTAGSYNVIIKNTGGCNSFATNFIIAQPIATWNGTTWSPSAPTSNDKIIFNGSYTTSSNLVGCSCQVLSGDIIISSDNSITLANELVVSGGSLTFENNASLVQTNSNFNNSGNIRYQRKTTPLKQYDYTYWSSPVSNPALSQLATNAAFYSFDPSSNNWVSQGGATTMTSGVGYIGRSPNNLTYSPTQVVETTFTGIPNNGDVTTSILKSVSTSNLIGNPYPSAIDADLFLVDAFNKNNINGTIYLWTHNTALINNSYTQNDYAKYNLIGGTKTASSALSGGTVPTGKIPAGQGFFVEANSSLVNGTYSVTFKNSMRVANNNNQFFKSNQSNAVAIEKHRFWVSLSTPQGAYNEFLIGYAEGATNSFDPLFDGRTIAIGNSVSIYSLLGNDNLAIQGRSLPFSTSDIIPIGYTTSLSGQLTINLENFDGLFDSQNVYLFDNTTGIYHDLKSSVYTFTTASGTFNNRFELRFNAPALNNNINSNSENKITIVNFDDQLVISSKNNTILKVEIYDVLGKLLFTKNEVTGNEFQTTINNVSSQLLIVKVTLDNQQTFTKKISLK